MNNDGKLGLSLGSSSSAEDLSQYTDADESLSAPTEILAEFLSSLMVKDYKSALELCKIILNYEPNHETVKELYPLIQQKMEHYNGQNHHDYYSSADDTSGFSDDSDSIGNSDSYSDNNECQKKVIDSEATMASCSSLEEEVSDDILFSSTSKYHGTTYYENSSSSSNIYSLTSSNATTPSDSHQITNQLKFSSAFKYLQKENASH